MENFTTPQSFFPSIRLASLVLASALLSACGSSSQHTDEYSSTYIESSYSDEGYSEHSYVEISYEYEGQNSIIEKDTHLEQYYPIELSAFRVTDTFGIQSDDDHTPLTLAPYIDEGRFSIHWNVKAPYQYTLDFRISTTRDIEDSINITQSYCGINEPCDLSGFQHCRISPDYVIRCADAGSLEQPHNPIDISSMIRFHAQTLYLFIEACDTESPWCEFSRLPVTIE